LKGLYQNLWRSLDTRRWKNSKTSHVFESLLLTLDSQDVFAVLLTGFGKSLFIRSYIPALFSELAFFVVRLRYSLLLLLAHPRPASWDLGLRKLGIQAVHILVPRALLTRVRPSARKRALGARMSRAQNWLIEYLFAVRLNSETELLII
jgi:hypothetical protein